MKTLTIVSGRRAHSLAHTPAPSPLRLGAWPGLRRTRALAVAALVLTCGAVWAQGQVAVLRPADAWVNQQISGFNAQISVCDELAPPDARAMKALVGPLRLRLQAAAERAFAGVPELMVPVSAADAQRAKDMDLRTGDVYKQRTRELGAPHCHKLLLQMQTFDADEAAASVRRFYDVQGAKKPAG